jgi:putative membrane protein
MTIIQSISLATLSLALFVGQGWAADSARSNDSAAASAQDREFVQKAVQGGLAELAAGKLASTKASSAEVKRFGAQMVTDHGKANSELANIAKSKG